MTEHGTVTSTVTGQTFPDERAGRDASTVEAV
jgi:hypothetical protein